MTTLLEKTYPRALETIIDEYSNAAAGTRLFAWTFDDREHRLAAERALSANGVWARIRSAYKPLVHYFLEEVSLDGLESVEVTYPIVSGCPAERFLLETYPLADLLPGVGVRFEAGVPEKSARALGPAGASYRVKLEYGAGHAEYHTVFAPNRAYVDHVGETVVTSAGWFRVVPREGSVSEGPLRTEYEAIYADALKTIAEKNWGETEPFFPTLSLRVALPIADSPLPVGQEAISLGEALHEELYFSVLEFFQKKTGRPVSDRRIMPGQVVPEIVYGETPSLTMTIRPLSLDDVGGESQDLPAATRPLSSAQVADELGRIEGVLFETRSVSGRKIVGKYHQGTDAAVMISGGQHANETTGVVGALRAAAELSKRPGAHFGVCPLENPDGYALHGLLCVDNPRHMHHAARYTAFGNDLEYQKEDSPYEKDIRVQALRLTGAKLHVNLHGYPCHEWTRPLDGYIPRGFPAWMLPHGFFLVLRHHAAWADRAREFLELLTSRLASSPDLLEFTRRQLKLYARYVAKPPFTVINGFPCDLSVNEASTIPLRLITEYPDETIYGEAFRVGQTAQTVTTIAAYDIFQAMAREGKLL